MGRILTPPGRVRVWMPNAPFAVTLASFRPSVHLLHLHVAYEEGELGGGDRAQVPEGQDIIHVRLLGRSLQPRQSLALENDPEPHSGVFSTLLRIPDVMVHELCRQLNCNPSLSSLLWSECLCPPHPQIHTLTC